VAGPRVLPKDTRLLHIGFRKCGTSALQSALRKARRELAALDVVYPDFDHTTSALAVTRRTNGRVALGAKPRPPADWHRLVDEVARLGDQQRALVSSEFFDVADEATISTIAAGLGGKRLHVVATIRPLSHVLPSSWQQNVQFGNRSSYEEWLRLVLDPDGRTKTHRRFWERHGHGDVLARWARVLGPQRLTLIVLDETDRELPFRTLETMLGVPKGTVNEIQGRTNRSLTLAEAEFIRRFNIEIFSHDVTWDEYTYWIRRGAAHEMWLKRTPDPDEPRIQTPRWALERAAEMVADLPERIASLGIEVVGDLARLTPPVAPAASPDHGDQPTSLPSEAAVHALVGACLSSRSLPPPPKASSAATTRDELTGRELAALFVEFARRKWRFRDAG
jgi:hypothetical protein